MKIGYKLIAAFSECKYKVSLLMEDIPCGNPPEFAIEHRARHDFLKARWLETMPIRAQRILLSSAQGLLENSAPFYGSIHLASGDLHCEVDGLEVAKSERSGDPTYNLLLVSIAFHPTEQDRTRLAFAALILKKITGREVTKGTILSADSLKRHSVSLTKDLPRLEKMIREITALVKIEDKEKNFLLNKHCGACAYSGHCKKKAMAAEHLSLIQNMPLREIKKQNSRGIFTLTQLSYTFQPRREKTGSPVKNNPALRALAIREKKTYIVHRPKMPSGKTLVFLDVEGLPEQNFFISSGFSSFTKGSRPCTSFGPIPFKISPESGSSSLNSSAGWTTPSSFITAATMRPSSRSSKPLMADGPET